MPTADDYFPGGWATTWALALRGLPDDLATRLLRAVRVEMDVTSEHARYRSGGLWPRLVIVPQREDHDAIQLGTEAIAEAIDRVAEHWNGVQVIVEESEPALDRIIDRLSESLDELDDADANRPELLRGFERGRFTALTPDQRARLHDLLSHATAIRIYTERGGSVAVQLLIGRHLEPSDLELTGAVESIVQRSAAACGLDVGWDALLTEDPRPHHQVPPVDVPLPAVPAGPNIATINLRLAEAIEARPDDVPSHAKDLIEAAAKLVGGVTPNENLDFTEVGSRALTAAGLRFDSAPAANEEACARQAGEICKKVISAIGHMRNHSSGPGHGTPDAVPVRPEVAEFVAAVGRSTARLLLERESAGDSDEEGTN